MLAFLLDEHISPVVAEQAARNFPGMKIIALRDWHDGSFLGTPDSFFIAEAAQEGLSLVTYDQRTIRPLLKTWIEQGVAHAGVVFVDGRTIAPHDFGGLVRAIGELWKFERRARWKDRVVFLTRPAKSP